MDRVEPGVRVSVPAARLARVLTLSSLAAAGLAAAVPSPESHFGHRMGADRKLVEWAPVVSYFQALEKSSDRIRVKELGKTTEGRPFIAAWISDAATLRRLDHYQQIQKRLADPRLTTEAEAARLAAEGKVVVMITCSIHSTEVASTMTAAEFAYRLLSEDRPRFRAILDNVIFILVPSLNPDGVDIVARWYRKTLGTPFEGTSPPELYHKYVGHDNNRDWYMFSQAETRLTISQLHNAWHPQIVYDVHQMGGSGARIFVPPWLDPVEPNIDPLLVQTTNMIGSGMAMDLTAAGKRGVVINAIYDFWTPARHYQAYHGGMRILSESASARLATPVAVSAGEIGERGTGYTPRQRTWNHLEPWQGGDWRVRDIVEYQTIAWESCLYQAALRREDLLRNFHGIGQRAVARTSPRAFLIPRRQADTAAAKLLLDTLAFGLVEIEQTAEDYVVRMQQPYSSWAKTLLERQQYPDLREYPGGPPRRPYDVTAHTLPLLLGVDVRATAEPPAGRIEPAREFRFVSAVPLAASDGDSWKEVNRIWAGGRPVWRDPASGDFSAEARPGWTQLRRPRLGLYRSHQPVMDEGWTRWILEQFGFAHQSVRNADVLSGNLRDRYDVIVIPDQGPSIIHNGYRPSSMPAEFTGGLGDTGAKALAAFVEAGGTLVTLNDSSNYAVGHLGVPVRNALRGIPPRDFYCPGSLLNVTLDSAHPLAKGLPAGITVWFESSPVFEVPEGSPVRTVARYGSGGVLASGWLLGEKHLAGRAALVDVPMGKGRAVLFGMRPQYRAQSYLTMKMLFNAFVM